MIRTLTTLALLFAVSLAAPGCDAGIAGSTDVTVDAAATCDECPTAKDCSDCTPEELANCAECPTSQTSAAAECPTSKAECKDASECPSPEPECKDGPCEKPAE